MLPMEEYGVRVSDPINHPIRFGSWDSEPLDCRACTTSNLWIRIAGGSGEGKYSCESEHDLGLMVRDFLENGSRGCESKYSSDSDSCCADLSHLAETVLLPFFFSFINVLWINMKVICHLLCVPFCYLSMRLSYAKGDSQCNASCIRWLLVKRLRVSGYDAAVCSSKWLGFDKIPGGDHEYIDIINDSVGISERFIVDIDFRSHFEIARAVKSYDAILTSLPVAYVGPLSRLEQFLRVMVDAAKYSLKQNSMPLPPWRSLSYLQAKWHSKFERKLDIGSKCNNSLDHGLCIGHLSRLKASLQSEIEMERLLKPITNDKKRMGKLQRRLSLLSS